MGQVSMSDHTYTAADSEVASLYAGTHGAMACHHLQQACHHLQQFVSCDKCTGSQDAQPVVTGEQVTPPPRSAGFTPFFLTTFITVLLMQATIDRVLFQGFDNKIKFQIW